MSIEPPLSKLPRRTIWQTKAVMAWEKTYATVVPSIAVLAVGVAMILMGLPQRLGAWGHGLSLLLWLTCAAAVGVWARRQVRGIAKQNAMSRLEQENHLRAGFFKDLTDRPSQQTDPRLWQDHQNDLLKNLGPLRPAHARALIDRTDPYALRTIAVLAFIISLIVAGPSWQNQLREGLWPRSANANRIIADVWIEPPAYAGLAPDFLLRGAPLSDKTLEAVNVTKGSKLNIRLSHTDGKALSPRITFATNESTDRVDLAEKQGAATATIAVQENSAVSIRLGGREFIVPFLVTPDAEPSVDWQEQPFAEGGVRTILPLKTDDDFGIETASLLVRLSEKLDLPPDVPLPDATEVDTVRRIPLPSLTGRPRALEGEIDLTELPWAGLNVDLAVEVVDGAGQIGQTDYVPYTLPTRIFYNRLAKTIVDERRNLSIAPSSWTRTTRLLDALTFAPDQFSPSGRDYLLLRTAYHDLFRGRGENIDTMIDGFWPLALALEDEALTNARARLEAAQQALREAINRGAPQSEIEQLIEELRDAMAAYVAALDASGDAVASSGANMETTDLDSILDEIAQLRREGNSAEARRRLAELEQLLQNLQISQGSGEGSGSGDGQSGSESEGEEANNTEEGTGENQAADLISKQRELADETFSARRGDRGISGLAEDQQALTDAAKSLLENGQDEAGGEDIPAEALEQAESAFFQALDAMDLAANALRTGRLTEANRLQEQAIEALRNGGRALADARNEEGNQQADQNGEGDQSRPQRVGQSEGNQRDPAGRLVSPQSETDLLDFELDSVDQIRELTEQLRKRLADPTLTPQQRDYLERLIDQY